MFFYLFLIKNIFQMFKEIFDGYYFFLGESVVFQKCLLCFNAYYDGAYKVFDLFLFLF